MARKKPKKVPPSTGRSEFADRLQQAMDRKGLNQQETEQACGLAKGYMTRLLAGDRAKVRIDTIEKIAAGLECSPSWLAWGRGRIDDAADMPEALIVAADYLGEKLRHEAIKVVLEWTREHHDEARGLEPIHFGKRLVDAHNAIVAGEQLDYPGFAHAPKKTLAG